MTKTAHVNGKELSPPASSAKKKTSKATEAKKAVLRGFSRPPLERMMRVHRQIQAGRFPNCRKLSETLEVSPKTVQRDIEFMRSRFELPIEYDPLQCGFYYSKPVSSFPGIEVTEGEIVALFVAQKALEQYRGTSFERPLRAAFRKISEGLQDSVTFRWGDLDAAISFRGLGTTEADLGLFDTFSKAVVRLEEVVFEYKKVGHPKYEERQVRPYHLACVGNQWYLFGFDLARQELRTFALPRVRKARMTGAIFERPADFDIARHLENCFGVFMGSGDYHIRIWFDAFAGQLVSERQWHASQQIKFLEEDGKPGIEMTMDLGSLEEIKRWILSWGTHARVLEPKELADQIKAVAKAMLGNG